MRGSISSRPVGVATGSPLSDIVAAPTTTPKRFARANDAPANARDLKDVARLLAEGVVDLPRGTWDPSATADLAGDAFVLMLLDGLALREVLLLGVPTAQVVMAGETIDLSGADHSPLCGEQVSWRVIEPTRVAVLGKRFLTAARQRPGLFLALHRRQAAQLRRAARYAAIVHLPRVEQRVLTLMWALAEERGHVRADGIGLTLDVTHEQLGRLVGARRPTVSLALKALADEGQLRRQGDAWTITPDPAPVAGAASLAVA